MIISKDRKGKEWTSKELANVIISTTRNDLITIDLSGPEGNAYVLMSYAKIFANKLSLDEDKIIEEMKSSDYENLLQVFDKYFGLFVVMYR